MVYLVMSRRCLNWVSVSVAAVAVGGLFCGCGESTRKTAAAPSPVAGEAPEGPTSAATGGPRSTAEPDVAPAGGKQPTPPTSSPAPTADAGTQPKPPTAPRDVKTPIKPHDRATLEAAYLEISCIQKKGQAAKLLAAYKKYGFEHPQAWIKAWESQKQTKDYEQWLAALTQKAWKACP